MMPYSFVVAEPAHNLDLNPKLRARDSLPGSVVSGRYHVDELLAEGGMGCVYTAYDAVEDRFVAIKVLQAHAASDEGVRRRFLNEARTTMRIGGPNVIAITDLGELDDGSAFYAMEFVDGHTLDEHRIDTFDEVKDIALQICSGLAAAHDAGVVHRDLKPENVMVTVDDDDNATCRLIDFGIAKLPFATIMTLPGTVLGTPDYIAPEQVRAREAVDHRCDIYALGVVLYELVSGTLPFDDEDPIRIALAHLGQKPQPVLERAPSCPAPLAALIMRCLEKRPDDRFEDIHVLAGELAAMPLEGLLDEPVRSMSQPAYGAGGTLIYASPTDSIEEVGRDGSAHGELGHAALGHGDTVALVTNAPTTPVPFDMPAATVARTKHLTPPAPEPWLNATPDSGGAMSQASPDYLTWTVVTAAAMLALAALASISLM